jgi:hypothetical protein
MTRYPFILGLLIAGVTGLAASIAYAPVFQGGVR